MHENMKVKTLAIVGVLAALLLAAWFWSGAKGRGASEDNGVADQDLLATDEVPTLRGQEREAPEVGDALDKAADAPADIATASIVAEGRIVDQRRHPVAGAVITVRVRNTILTRTESDDSGSFTLDLGPIPTTAIHATIHAMEGSRGARGTLYLRPHMPRRFSARTLMLRPTHALEVLVVADGRPIPGARVVLLDSKDTQITGLSAEGLTTQQGHVRFDGLVASRVRVFAHAKGWGRGRTECDVPRDGGPIKVELPADRALDVIVKHAATGDPVADAEVLVSGERTMSMPGGTGCLPEIPPLRTDENGRVRVSGLPPGHLGVIARANRLAPVQHGMTWKRAPVAPEDTEVEVLLHPYRTLRFPIGPSTAGAPDDGTALEVVRYQPIAGSDKGAVSARIEDGAVVIGSFPPVFDRGHVLAPDGRWASFQIPMPGQDRKVEKVFFKRSRDVVVRLTTRDGRALANEWLWLIIRPRGRGTHRLTDESGMAEFPRLQGKSATVMWTPDEHGFGTPVASVDLGTPADITEVVVTAPIRIRLAVTIDGVARLPSSYRLQVPDTDSRRPAGRLRSVQESEIEEDAETGEIALRWLGQPEGSPLSVTIEGEGCVPVTVSPTLGSDRTWRGAAALRRATTLIVRVDPPEDARWHVMLERWNEESQGFFAAPDESSMNPVRGGTREIQRYEGLRPDRYRLRELVTKHTSEPFEISAGGEKTEVPFDLSSIVLVKGKVLLPGGEDAAFAQVVVDRPPEPGRMPERPIYVNADGTFEHRALRGSAVRFKVMHPLPRAAREGGEQEIVVGQETPVLRLERTVEVVFRIEGSEYTTPAPDARIYGGPHFGGPVQVRAARAGDWTPETTAVHALARKGLFRIAIKGTGPWTLRVEIEGHVPVDLASVEIKAGANDLGTLRPMRGARLRLRLLSTTSTPPEFVRAEAQLVGEIPYTRSGWKIEPGDPPSVSIAGLGKGRFKVTLTVQERPDGRRAPAYVERFAQEVESDGESEIVLDVKLP